MSVVDDLIRMTSTDPISGVVTVFTLSYEQMAQFMRREPICGYGDEGVQISTLTLDDQIAALRARQDQIEARRDQMLCQYPQLKSYSGRKEP